jgi:small subunit ribosomal protein S1
MAERKAGDTVSGRIVDLSGNRAKVELGEGVVAHCKLAEQKASDAPASASKTDISVLSAMLAQKWKTGGGTEASLDAPHAGQVRSFRIISVDPAQKRIELELA